ncbi:hypothetical protein MJT46_007500 [Ovis ammon polii x Ovis aries]|nr:hypothetical protein MJT46_007500 [Ovis ammon polii x Ovis aries]
MKGERNSIVGPPFQESPRCVSPFQRNLFSRHCLDVQAEDRLPPRVHVGQPSGKASWESLVGKTRGKDSRENHRSFDPRGGLRDTAATALEESASAYPHSRRGLTPLGRLQKYPKIHVSTGEESSGFGPDSTQGLRPRHRRERNPERPPRNSHGDWPFLRPPERVPEVPVVSREHLPQLEKIQEVFPPGEMRPISAEASRGQSHLTTGTSKGSFTPLLQLKKFPDIPVSTLEEARGSRTHPEEPRFRLIARDEGSFPCLVGKEFPAFPSHLKRRHSPQQRREELQHRAAIPRVPQISQSILEEPVFPALPRLSR